MTFIESYGKEIVALFVPFITWMLNRFFKAKASLQIAHPHTFTFLVQEPLLDQQGNMVKPTQTINTRSLVVINSGREMATKVEVVLNWKPMCINIWPPRHFTEYQETDNRHILVFDTLAPKEVVGCEILSINFDLPDLIVVRSDQCTAQFVNMHSQPVIGRWLSTMLTILIFLGMATAVYGVIFLIQFLVLKTPFLY